MKHDDAVKNVIRELSLTKRILVMLLVTSLHGMTNAESLYEPQSYKSLVSDDRAYHIGDVVTLIVVESAQAQSSKDAGYERTLGVEGGFEKTGRAESGAVDLGVRSNGGETTQRSGEFRTQITVEVQDIDEVGKLFVAGSQKIVIDGKEQTIDVSGWLRPRDITPQNTALSLRLSHASIEFVGDSVQRDKGLIRKGWDFMKKIW